MKGIRERNISEFEQKYMEIIEKNYESFRDNLGSLIAIPSVVDEAEGNMPFGKNVDDALNFVLDLAEKDGFTVKNVDKYGGHIDFLATESGSKDKTWSDSTHEPGNEAADEKEIVAVVGHLDVVPAGDRENWSTDPFKMVEKDGKFFGRGVLDDKGPLLAGYYAVKALKEAGFTPSKTIRLILGCDEETEWKGMRYYIEAEQPNVLAGFSPDADFPAIHAEKGCSEFLVERKIAGESEGGRIITRMSGGTVPNAVADKAVATLNLSGSPCGYDAAWEKISSLAKSFKPSTRFDVEFENLEELITLEKVPEDNAVLLTSHGVSAHGSRPDLGLNAISIMMDFLGQLDLPEGPSREVVDFYNQHLGYTFNGENIGVAFSDEPSGKLSLNVGLVDINEDKAGFTLDIRYPVTMDLDDVYDGLRATVVPEGYRVKCENHMAPLYKPVDDPLIVTLMEAYKEFTGDEKSEPIVIGGGTYARAVPNTVAFGPVMPGREDICHQPNEYIFVEDLYTSIKIFAKALYELAR